MLGIGRLRIDVYPFLSEAQRPSKPSSSDISLVVKNPLRAVLSILHPAPANMLGKCNGRRLKRRCQRIVPTVQRTRATATISTSSRSSKCSLAALKCSLSAAFGTIPACNAILSAERSRAERDRLSQTQMQPESYRWLRPAFLPRATCVCLAISTSLQIGSPRRQ